MNFQCKRIYLLVLTSNNQDENLLKSQPGLFLLNPCSATGSDPSLQCVCVWQILVKYWFNTVYSAPPFQVLTLWLLVVPNDKVWSCCSSHMLPLCLFCRNAVFWNSIVHVYLYLRFCGNGFLFLVDAAFTVLYSVPSLAFLTAWSHARFLFKPNTVSHSLCFLLLKNVKSFTEIFVWYIFRLFYSYEVVWETKWTLVPLLWEF